jgi:hypothetical protein
MGIAPYSLKKNYWEEFEILSEDLEFLYNHLLEIETPLTPTELVKVLVSERVRKEKETLIKQQTAGGEIYTPKGHFETGQSLQFPSLDWRRGEIKTVRTGVNPELPPFEVIDVVFENEETLSFASGLEKHILNQPLAINLDDPQLNEAHVVKTYGAALIQSLTEELESNPDIIRIAGRWFPRALLVDINVGHLNLVEAVLEMENGGPLPARTLMEQIDLPKDVNPKLNEFSLNLALQEDGRFDEVGPSGQILWYLHRLEPEPVLQPPLQLRYFPTPYDAARVAPLIKQFEGLIPDELETCGNGKINGDEVSLSLLYPHLRAGTLPLCEEMIRFFPTAYESPRVQFTLVDADSGQKLSCWVVRTQKYIYGLREWYVKNDMMPGSILTIQRGAHPGEVFIRANRKRPARDWVRTAMIGVDGGIVFALLKHSLTSTLDERMAIVISDMEALDRIWESSAKLRGTLLNTVKEMMRELSKLSPQGHIHAQELYAAVNIVRRCPPGPILNLLVENPWAVHLGDLYFKLDETAEETR